MSLFSPLKFQEFNNQPIWVNYVCYNAVRFGGLFALKQWISSSLDTQLYISFKPDGSATETDAVDALQACIRDIRTWMVQDKLQLNDAKTEFLIIGTRA